jgi:hypothetical protein
MRLIVNHRLLVALLLGGVTLLLASPNVEANAQLSNPESWIDQLTTYVVIQKVSEQQGNFDPYLEQIKAMRTVLRQEWKQGDLRGTYAAMNRLMEMLQRREGGIRVEVAEAITDFRYQVAPMALHYGQGSTPSGGV